MANSKQARVTVYREDAVRITAHFKDFAGTVSEWKDAIYELFRWDMTWSFAHKIDVIESRSNGVFVSLSIKPKFEKPLLETMEDLGFRNIICVHEDIGAIECTDLPDDMLIGFAVVDY